MRARTNLSPSIFSPNTFWKSTSANRIYSFIQKSRPSSRLGFPTLSERMRSRYCCQSITFKATTKRRPGRMGPVRASAFRKLKISSIFHSNSKTDVASEISRCWTCSRGSRKSSSARTKFRVPAKSGVAEKSSFRSKL